MSSKQGRSHLRVPTRRHPQAKGLLNSPAQQPTGNDDDSQPSEKQSLLKSRTRLSAVIVVVVLLLIVLIAKLSGSNGNANADIDNSLNQPSYQTMLPTGKTIQQLGGWQRVSPEDKDPVFAYSDSIGTVPIAVSQQPLPSNFSGDSEARLADLAKKFSATKRLSTANGTAYVGTSAKGPQSAILIKGSTLVLIKSQNNIDDQSWVAYIDSLGLSY